MASDSDSDSDAMMLGRAEVPVKSEMQAETQREREPEKEREGERDSGRRSSKESDSGDEDNFQRAVSFELPAVVDRLCPGMATATPLPDAVVDCLFDPETEGALHKRWRSSCDLETAISKARALNKRESIQERNVNKVQAEMQRQRIAFGSDLVLQDGQTHLSVPPLSPFVSLARVEGAVPSETEGASVKLEPETPVKVEAKNQTPLSTTGPSPSDVFSLVAALAGDLLPIAASADPSDPAAASALLSLTRIVNFYRADTLKDPDSAAIVRGIACGDEAATTQSISDWWRTECTSMAKSLHVR
ncbi:hypothetical protein KIPB_010114, partial [Kipferlia bialata]|eukprot:g10114.t1